MNVIFVLFFLLNFGGNIFVSAFPSPNENTGKEPTLILRDSYDHAPGEKKDIIQELACQAPPHISMFGNMERPHQAIYKDYFSPIEEVWVAVEIPGPTSAQLKAQQIRIYVIEHQEDKPLKDGDELHDVSGGYEDVLLQPDCAHAVYTPVWSKPSIREQGYDVVVDFKNSSGQYGTYEEAWISWTAARKAVSMCLENGSAWRASPSIMPGILSTAMP